MANNVEAIENSQDAIESASPQPASGDTVEKEQKPDPGLGLFNMLPPEMRQKIYDHLLDNLLAWLSSSTVYPSFPGPFAHGMFQLTITSKSTTSLFDTLHLLRVSKPLRGDVLSFFTEPLTLQKLAKAVLPTGCLDGWKFRGPPELVVVNQKWHKGNMVQKLRLTAPIIFTRPEWRVCLTKQGIIWWEVNETEDATDLRFELQQAIEL